MVPLPFHSGRSDPDSRGIWRYGKRLLKLSNEIVFVYLLLIRLIPRAIDSNDCFVLFLQGFDTTPQELGS